MTSLINQTTYRFLGNHSQFTVYAAFGNAGSCTAHNVENVEKILTDI